MRPVIIEGDIIQFTFSVGTIVPTVTNVVVNSSDKLTVDGLKVAVASDIINTPSLAVTYKTPTASIPGTGNMTINWWAIQAQDLFKDNEFVVTNDSQLSGSAILTVQVPAQIPGTPPVPDPIVAYLCNFKIITTQNKLLAD